MRTPSPLRTGLLVGVSALACLLPAIVHAQSAAALAAASGMSAAAAASGAAVARSNARPLPLIRDQASAAARQVATRQRLMNAVSMATQAQSAARAAAAALAQTVPNGLAPGGLRLAAGLVPAAQDLTGTRTLQGALAPVVAQGGRIDIQQTESRAVLSWDSFNVGRDTHLNFIQGTGAVDAATGRPAVAERDWIALNRVVGQLDPTTGRRDPTKGVDPSRILGRITGDGTVLVINQNGVLFGATGTTRTRGLIATSLEVGRIAQSGLAGRNDEFLSLGLLGFADRASNSDLSGAFTFSAQGTTLANELLVEGDVRVDAGADLVAGDLSVSGGITRSGDNGLLLLVAPRVVNGGALSANAGQVSLVSARRLTLLRATGTADSADAAVRGLVAAGSGVQNSDYVLNTGIIASPRGYLSLDASGAGAVIQQGVLTSTTSVSRNGAIDLFAPDIRVAPGATIAITADGSGETIPQAPDSVAAFKTSRVRLNGGRIEIAAGALIHAPGADVLLGTASATTGDTASPGSSRVFIDDGAVIDVGGIKDFLVPASRNSLTIGPLKRNDLRDTPLYREPLSNEEIAAGSERFTLNGVTVSIDPRRSGVRADGVGWVGSPLIEAQSYFEQVGVTAAELLTRGGSIAVGVLRFDEFAGGVRRDPALAPDVIVKGGATLDVSGGWVRYEGGVVRTSQLVTRGGQIVDIGNADPNADYVGLVTPFETSISRFGRTSAFSNAGLEGARVVAAYTEGRDAGALRITGSALALDGRVYGDAYAGSLQRGDARAGTAVAAATTDRRRLQTVSQELPAGALLAINAIAGADILVTKLGAFAAVPGTLAYGQSVAIGADGALVRPMRDPASLLSAARRDTILFADETLSAIGLGQLTLQSAGMLDFAADTQTRLMPYGVLEASTGRTIRVAGTISAPGGVIDLATFDNPARAATNGGSPFRDDPVRPGAFDIVVTGTLSAAGRVVNDQRAGEETGEGAAATDGGTIRLAVAPRVVGAGTTPGKFVDLSGSILINPGALLDVAGGAYVAGDGTIDTGAVGGNVALVNETNYAQITNDYVNVGPGTVRGFRFTVPAPFASSAVAPNPTTINARVLVSPGTIRGHGFGGGGRFTLTTPAFAFGSGAAAVGTVLPLDFIGGAGFAAYDLTVFKTALFANRFVNTLGGTNALLDTEIVRVGAGQTLRLTQAEFDPLLGAARTTALRQLATGGEIYTAIAPSVPVAAFDQRAVDLGFGGLVEFAIAAGGRVEGAAGASLRSAKLVNAGTIRLPGGTVTQREALPLIYTTRDTIGIRALSDVFTVLPGGDIPENAPNAAGIAALGFPRILTNAELAFERAIYFLGALDAGDGIRLEAGSITDLSGVSLRNPRATDPRGRPIVDGRLVAGGTLTSAPALVNQGRLFETGRFFTTTAPLGGADASAVAGRSLVALPGATIALSGVADSYARPNADGLYVATPQWSDGGLLGLGSGGTLAGAMILADGGAVAATGGTFVARNPILVATDPAIAEANVFSAAMLVGAGFDTLVAEGSLTGRGAVDLALGRALFVQSVPFDGQNTASALYGVRIDGDGPLTVTAPIIRFDSITQAATVGAGTTSGTGQARFIANALDVEGAVVFGSSLASVRLEGRDAVRLIGTAPILEALTGVPSDTPSLAGQLLGAGALTLAGGQVYPTTGSSFVVASSGTTGSVTIEKIGATPATPYSAGAAVTIQAASVTQSGVLRAPLGQLTLGGNAPLVRGGLVVAPATTALTLSAGGVTSVAANGLSIPYGTTTDQVEYFFTPTVAGELSAPPAGVLRLAGARLDLAAGSTVDLTGGGDVFAFEFVPGVGGSRDLLDRLNPDPFSSNDGLQFADGRQVFAIVPALANAGLPTLDPVYAADYAALRAPEQAGRRVYLEAAPGLTAGWYTLLPARYALLPGGLRVVEQPAYGRPIPGSPQVLRDGTKLVAGYYGTTGTPLRDSEIRTFAVQDQASIRQFSTIATTTATTTFAARARRNGLTAPRLPIDSARLILEPIASLTANAAVLSAPAAGGRAATADIAGTRFGIVSTAPAVAPADTIIITAATLNSLNVASLLIGGTRTDNADGTTSLAITARDILLANSIDTALTAPELLLAVDGAAAAITLADGAAIVSGAGAIDPRAGVYLIDGASPTMTGNGALVRVASGAERLARRINQEPGGGSARLTIGLARVRGQSVLLDSTGDLRVASPAVGRADIEASALAVGAGAVAFTRDPVATGLVVTPELQAAFAAAQRLTIRSGSAIAFTGGSYGFGALALDTPGFALRAGGGDAVMIITGALTLSNSGPDAGACTLAGPLACGTGALAVNAASIAFGSGQLRSFGFGSSVALSATGGIVFDGAGGLDVGPATLAVATPLIADRARPLAPGDEALLPSLTLASAAAVTITRPVGAVLPAVVGTPGARLTISGRSVGVDGARLAATAGTLDLRATGADVATGSVALTGGAVLAAPAYARVFGDSADPVAVAAPGGLVRITSGNGDVVAAADTTITVGGTAGKAGEIALIAGRGRVQADGTLDASAPDGAGAFTLVSGGAFDLARFAGGAAAGFGRGIAIRTGAGDLSLGVGQRLAARTIGLTADAGSIAIAGTIDASGIDGGDVALFGGGGVTLAPTARILATATGYAADDSRQAHGGDVTLGTQGSGAVAVAAGAVIDVSAQRPGDRLVADVRNGQTFYRVADGDLGGTLLLRAPIIELAGPDSAAVTSAGSVIGAREIVLEAYRRFDLAEVLAGGFSGVAIAGGVATLDTGAAGNNFLSGADARAIPALVQNFDVSGAYAGLGTLAAAPMFHARPGIELVFAGDVTLQSNWNFAAGTVDTARALVDGVIVPRAGTPAQNVVVAGREADLLRGYTRFLYRTGGDIVDDTATAAVTGEPGAIAIRAGGTLRIQGSISDGFFTFRDQSDPEFLSFALGGGTRVFQPLLRPVCSGRCSTAPAFDPTVPTPTEAIRLRFTAAGVVGTADTLIDAPAPLSAAANSAAARGSGIGGAGDAFGSAELFPRIGGRAPDSWSLGLVGGADLATTSAPRPSVDPGATLAGGGAVVVTGETSFTQQAVRGTSRFQGGLLVDARPTSSAQPVLSTPSEFVARLVAAGANPLGTTAITLTGSSVQATTLLQAGASAYFSTLDPASYRLSGPAAAPTEVVTTLAQAGQFVERIAAGYAALAAANQAGIAPPLGANGPVSTNFVRTLVRTGTGDIAVAAAGNIDLTGGPARLRASGNGTTAVQVGGTAIYTAGARAAIAARSIADPADGVVRTIDPATALARPSVFAQRSAAPVAGAFQADALYLDRGGDVALAAGGDVLARRDVQGAFRLPNNTGSTFIGAPDQVWRIGQVGQATDIRINPQLFPSGVATLGGGDIAVRAGRDLVDLTAVALTANATADVTGGGIRPTAALLTTGGGNVALAVGRDMVGGLFDVGEGRFDAAVGRDIAAAAPLLVSPGNTIAQSNGVRVRLTDAVARFEAGGTASLRGVAAFGPRSASEIGTANQTPRGFYTPTAGVSVIATGRVTTTNVGGDVIIRQPSTFDTDYAIYPGSFEAMSITGDLVLAVETGRSDTIFLYPSPKGQLRLFAGADITPVAIVMDDGDPGLLPGYFSSYDGGPDPAQPRAGRSFGFPTVLSNTTETQRRLLHNAAPTHLGDVEPIRIAAGNDIAGLVLNAPKQARIAAGRDLVDAVVIGQNLAATDTTRVTAGRDIIATTSLVLSVTADPADATLRPALRGNSFIVGGPGAIFVEAGRDAGPFLNSATVDSAREFATRTIDTLTVGGGVLSIGNEYNPWLRPVGADIYVQFGTARGVNYAGLRDTYVDPANIANLADDLFEQIVDPFGQPTADRTRPIYGPILIAWIKANAAAELAAAGLAPATLAYADAYRVFRTLPELRQRPFLLRDVYFNELTQTSIPTSVSYLRYSRGYRAVNTLFPPALGYTANDLSGGGATGTAPVETGNLDLRLATIQTARGGDIAILGPGGRVLGGSTVRTSAQAARRNYLGVRRLVGLEGDIVVAPQPQPAAITTIPSGFEGVITLRGGAIRGFTDRDILLNQSRIFTQAGGDIALWSSNGDLNAGQGPKTSANFPPVVVRISADAGTEVDAVGGVAGAGIAAFQPASGVPAPNVFLIAPRGTVDAGDAGVRVSGNLFVAALSVANADNFSVGGTAFGIPAGPVVNVGAQSAGSAAGAAAAAAAKDAANANSRRQADLVNRILVEVLGTYGGGDPCDRKPRPANCPVPR